MRPLPVEVALASLEGLARRGQAPSHYLAREVLLTLGETLRERTLESSAALERARSAGKAAGEGWSEAVQDELTLACGEFVQCLDPRYLALPNYDLEYTRSARLRLADRLLAAKELGFEPSARETELLELADQVLATLTSARQALRGDRDPPSTPPDG